MLRNCLIACVLLLSFINKLQSKEKILHPDIVKALTSNNSHFVLLLRGGKWSHDCTVFTEKVWNDPKFRSEFKSSQLIDIKIEQNYDNSLFKLPVRMLHLPSIAVLDKAGRPVALWDTIDSNSATEGALKFIKKSQHSLLQRNQYFESSATGVERAIQIGKGLDCIERLQLDSSWKAQYQSIFDEMLKVDPKDKSGYILKYVKFDKEIEKIVSGSRHQATLMKPRLLRVNEHLKNKRLSDLQKQQLLVSRYTVLSYGVKKKQITKSEFKKTAIADFNTILKLAPTSVYSRMVPYLKKELDVIISSTQ